MAEFITFVSALAGLFGIVQFLRGYPSIHHFVPLQFEHLRTFVALPLVKGRFSVRDDTLFLHTVGREVALLPYLSYLAEGWS